MGLYASDSSTLPANRLKKHFTSSDKHLAAMSLFGCGADVRIYLLKKRGANVIYVAVCDDEQIILDGIENLASDFFHSKNIEAEIFLFSSGEELLNSDQHIDILFLDIRMGQIDGIETAKKMRNKGYKGYLIFITVLKEMVFQSFEVQPFDYLLKPIAQDYLTNTMERLLFSMKSAEKEILLVRRGAESSIVSLNDIIFVKL